MRFFTELGRRVALRFRAANLDPACFPEIAAEALEETPPSAHVCYEEVVDALAFGQTLPPPGPLASFGEPAIVVFDAPHFRIEVLCWVDGTTEIHEHAFSGAFHVMAGSSLHSVYDFYPASNGINHPHIAIGALRHRASELLRAGAVRRITPGANGLRHSLFHLDRPSISVVVRTHSEPQHLPQRAFHGDVAVTPLEYTEDRTTPRVLQVLTMLATTDRGAFVQLAERCVTEGDLGMTFHVLERVERTRHAGEDGEHEVAADAIGAAAAERWGSDLIATFRAAHERLARAEDLATRRREVVRPDLRFFLALLLNVPRREPLLELVREVAPDADPAETARGWLRELLVESGPSAVDLLDLELALDSPIEGLPLAELVLAVLAGALAGHRRDALVAAVCRSAPRIDAERVRPLIERIEQSLPDSALAPLVQ